MQEKTKKLLDKMGLNKDYYQYFEHAILNKIVGNSDKTKYRFNISNDKILPSFVYDEFISLLKETFKDYESISAVFEVEEIENEKIIEFYQYFLKRYCENRPSLQQFLAIEPICDNNVLKVNLIGKAEELKFKKVIKDLENDFKHIGIKKIDFDLNVEEIPETKEEVIIKEVVRDEETLIKGRRFKGKVEKIATIEYSTIEDYSIPAVIQGKIFKVDSREFAKINLITFSINDGTGSITCKIFERDADSYNEMKDRIKIGSSAMIRGNIKWDNFDKDQVLFANDMILVKEQEESVRKDTQAEKRVELHAHTMMSQMDGVIDGVKLVKQAIKFGHKAVAITDHDSCQSFPNIYNEVSFYNSKLEEPIKKQIKALEEDIKELEENNPKIEELRKTLDSLNEEKKKLPRFKVLYGLELGMSDDSLDVVVNHKNDEEEMSEKEFVIFDTETTGFNPGLHDSIIEIGAVIMKDGIIKERFNELINPNVLIDKEITMLTGITNEMVADKDTEENVVKRFKDFIKDLPIVAHNAKFDRAMIDMAYYKYNLGPFDNPILDTMVISQLVNKDQKKHNLTALAKKYGINFSENDDEDTIEEKHHHRADYDAENTGYIFFKMLKQLEDISVLTFKDLAQLPTKEDTNKFSRESHLNIIAKNRDGLKNLFKILSIASTVDIVRATPKIPRYKLEESREGLLIGCGCSNGEVFKAALNQTEEQLKEVMKFYDYIEVQPLSNYTHLVARHDINSMEEVKYCLEKIIKCAKELRKLIVATSDAHILSKEDKIYREIIVNQNIPGKGRHPLARYLETEGYETIPDQYFRTTDEMLEEFNFLDEELRKEIVITNTNKIADMCEEIKVIIQAKNPFSPKIENSAEIVKDLVFTKAHEMYGDPLPDIVNNRINDELKGIIGGGFDVIYLISQKLVKHSNDEGYLVGSRGSVGSSFVATMMGITEVNPLSAHYVCPECKHSIFEENGELLGAKYSSGFDLPDKDCPKCNCRMEKDGQDMPFATFLGFNADKVPDIDLNFSGVNQASAHAYTKVLFGEDNVYRAGTIGTVADKTAYGYVLGYFEDKEKLKGKKIMNRIIKPAIQRASTTRSAYDIEDAKRTIEEYRMEPRVFEKDEQADKLINEIRKIEGFSPIKTGISSKKREIKTNIRKAEIERLAQGCTGVKRTTGQHPGGIVVIPDYMDVFDFTPFQFPADDSSAEWRTTHFDYHAIDQDLLKLDILGHDDPTVLKMLQDISKKEVEKSLRGEKTIIDVTNLPYNRNGEVDITKVPLDDKKTMSIFSSPEVLNVTKDQIMCETGTLGVPEFGTKFVIQMLVDTKPQTFAELVKISGLSHGTDVWLGNAQDLILNNIVPFSNVIGCRDDIMVYLSYNGLEPLKAFKIMEFVRKGKASKEPDAWRKFEQEMKEHKIESWFIESCYKIKYMFPKAHAAAYVISSYRIAWYKVHYPILYYSSYLSIRCNDFDIDAMIRGYDAIKTRMLEITEKGMNASNKETAIYEVLQVALEATARGFKFANIDLEKSDANHFLIMEDGKTLLPPFRTLDGLGGTVAEKIVEERKLEPFKSVDDLKKRGKVSTTLIERMKNMKILDGLPDASAKKESEVDQLSLF
ncbi:MAG: PolC-type DNA polymerase III [Bacilli bacterium]|nr:PolC-type DNA polymerase III [Bacilli bacterium]